MGKTGLLEHVKYQPEHSKKPYSVIYVDLLPAMNGNEMLNSITSTLYRLRKNEKNFIRNILGLFASLRPTLTVDPLTGEPSQELKKRSSSGILTGIDQVIKLISEIKQDLVFMIDEFQQICHYPEKNIESILRSVSQTYPLVPFIFSGSSKQMLENMAMSPGRPFYQSSEIMYLDRIRDSDYRDFIKFNFIQGKREKDEHP